MADCQKRFPNCFNMHLYYDKLWKSLDCLGCCKAWPAPACHRSSEVCFSKKKYTYRCLFTPTKFWLHKAIGDSQIVSSNSLSVDHTKQSEFGRQRVHDHWQVSLSNLRTKTRTRWEQMLDNAVKNRMSLCECCFCVWENIQRENPLSRIVQWNAIIYFWCTHSRPVSSTFISVNDFLHFIK